MITRCQAQRERYHMVRGSILRDSGWRRGWVPRGPSPSNPLPAAQQSCPAGSPHLDQANVRL